MEIHFEAGLKRARDATESAKLVSEAAVAVRCHAVSSQRGSSTGMIDNTQFNTFLDHLSVSNVISTQLVILSCSVPYFLASS